MPVFTSLEDLFEAHPNPKPSERGWQEFCRRSDAERERDADLLDAAGAEAGDEEETDEEEPGDLDD